MGLVGEYAKSGRWKRHFKAFEMLVINGVAGELVADGDIFLFSANLTTITDAETSLLRKEAPEADERASKAVERAAKAEENLAGAKERAAHALETAESARKDAAEWFGRLAMHNLLFPNHFVPMHNCRPCARALAANAG